MADIAEVFLLLSLFALFYLLQLLHKPLLDILGLLVLEFGLFFLSLTSFLLDSFKLLPLFFLLSFLSDDLHDLSLLSIILNLLFSLVVLVFSLVF